MFLHLGRSLFMHLEINNATMILSSIGKTSQNARLYVELHNIQKTHKYHICATKMDLLYYIYINKSSLALVMEIETWGCKFKYTWFKLALACLSSLLERQKLKNHIFFSV